MADVVTWYRSDLSVLPGEAVLSLANSMGMGIALSLFSAWIWSSVTSFAFLRGALELSKLRASALLLLYTLLLWGIVISLLVVTETIPLHRITSLS